MFKKFKAFTLAEVLITLGIIGVVAALTLPTLIQNHQKQVYVTQLKKAYSTINNAYNKMANAKCRLCVRVCVNWFKSVLV